MLKHSAAIAGAAAITFLAHAEPAQAGPDPYLGDIVMTAGSYCPMNWTEAAGQLLPISQNQALFAIMGTTYGGDGRTTFALPDLRSRVAVGIGQGPGLSNIQQGERAGAESATLSALQLPAHTHSASSSATTVVNASNESGSTEEPENAVLAATGSSTYSANAAVDTTLRSDAAATTVTTTIGQAGSSQPVSIMQPFIGIRFCIALEGAFPPRN